MGERTWRTVVGVWDGLIAGMKWLATADRTVMFVAGAGWGALMAIWLLR